MPRHLISFILVLVSVGLLYPGVTQPMFYMDLKCKVISSFGNLELDVMNSSYSILATVTNLIDRGKGLVGGLILIFSVVVPLIKAVMFLTMLASDRFRDQINTVLGYISKWSMADVFVVAIFLAYMATGNETQSQVHDLSLMGMQLKVKVDMLMHSDILPGFYYFLSYCLVSMIAVTVYKLESKREI